MKVKLKIPRPNLEIYEAKSGDPDAKSGDADTKSADAHAKSGDTRN